jgi:hypothetical protein
MAPDFSELRATDIRQAVAGMRLRPDFSLGQPAFLDFDECFEADGRWRSARAQRAMILLTGRWSVEGDQLCVSVETRNRTPFPRRECRTLSRHARTGQLMMTSLIGEPTPLVFNATPILP